MATLCPGTTESLLRISENAGFLAQRRWHATAVCVLLFVLSRVRLIWQDEIIKVEGDLDAARKEQGQKTI